MKAPLNYPLVLIDTTDQVSEDNLNKYPFLFIKSEREFKDEIDNFVNPCVSHYYSVINKAAELSGLKFDNRNKTYISKMNKNEFKSLSSYSKEEVKEAIMQQVNWLAAIGFSVKRSESLQFRCSSEGKTIIFNDRKVILEGVDPDNITIDLMFHGSDKFRKILSAFEIIKKYQGLPIDEVELYGYRKPIEPEFSMNKSRINNLAEFKNEVVEAHPFTDMVKSDNDTLNINTLVTKVLEDIQKYNPDATMKEVGQKIHEAILGEPKEIIVEKEIEPGIVEMVELPKEQDIFVSPKPKNEETISYSPIPNIFSGDNNSTGHINIHKSTTNEPLSEAIDKANKNLKEPITPVEYHICQHCKKRPFTQNYNGMLLCGKCYTDAINLV